MRIFGRKSRGPDIGKKGSKLVKGVKALGLGLVASPLCYKETLLHEASNSSKQSVMLRVPRSL